MRCKYCGQRMGEKESGHIWHKHEDGYYMCLNNIQGYYGEPYSKAEMWKKFNDAIQHTKEQVSI